MARQAAASWQHSLRDGDSSPSPRSSYDRGAANSYDRQRRQNSLRSSPTPSPRSSYERERDPPWNRRRSLLALRPEDDDDDYDDYYDEERQLAHAGFSPPPSVLTTPQRVRLPPPRSHAAIPRSPAAAILAAEHERAELVKSDETLSRAHALLAKVEKEQAAADERARSEERARTAELVAEQHAASARLVRSHELPTNTDDVWRARQLLAVGSETATPPPPLDLEDYAAGDFSAASALHSALDDFISDGRISAAFQPPPARPRSAGGPRSPAAELSAAAALGAALGTAWGQEGYRTPQPYLPSASDYPRGSSARRAAAAKAARLDDGGRCCECLPGLDRGLDHGCCDADCCQVRCRLPCRCVALALALAAAAAVAAAFGYDPRPASSAWLAAVQNSTAPFVGNLQVRWHDLST